MTYGNFGSSRQLLGGADIGKLKLKGILQDEEYAYVEGDIVMAENVKTQDKRVLGRAAELLAEGSSKRVLKG